MLDLIGTTLHECFVTLPSHASATLVDLLSKVQVPTELSDKAKAKSCDGLQASYEELSGYGAKEHGNSASGQYTPDR